MDMTLTVHNPEHSQSRSRGADELANMRSDKKRHGIVKSTTAMTDDIQSPRKASLVHLCLQKRGQWWGYAASCKSLDFGSGGWIMLAHGGVLEERRNDDGREQVTGRRRRSSNGSICNLLQSADPPRPATMLSTKP